MIVLVTGGRDFEDGACVYRTLDKLHTGLSHVYAITPFTHITKIRTGACVNLKGELCGADKWALFWALANEVDFDGRPARWSEDGYPQAGPMRNERMALEVPTPTIVLAFPGGRGTESMCGIGRRIGIPVLRWDQV